MTYKVIHNSITYVPRLYIGRHMGFNKAFVDLINSKMERPARAMVMIDEKKHRLKIRFYSKADARSLGNKTFSIVDMNNRLVINLTERRKAYIDKIITKKDPHYVIELQHDEDGYYIETDL